MGGVKWEWEEKVEGEHELYNQESYNQINKKRGKGNCAKDL